MQWFTELRVISKILLYLYLRRRYFASLDDRRGNNVHDVIYFFAIFTNKERNKNQDTIKQ